MNNVEEAQSIIECEAAGNLDTDEKAFHAWVKALAGASEKLGAQELEKLENITRELPLIERLWLYEIATSSSIVSKGRQKRAIHVLEHCLKADIKPDEEEELIAYLVENRPQYGNAMTREDAEAFLKQNV